MTSPHRKRRGAQTQTALATYLAEHGWPYATDAGAGRQGTDILGTPDLTWEVKARRDFDPLGWLRQASRADGPNQRSGLPIVVLRPDGMGPGRIADWPTILRLSDLIDLLRAAGYGDPPTDTNGENSMPPTENAAPAAVAERTGSNANAATVGPPTAKPATTPA